MHSEKTSSACDNRTTAKPVIVALDYPSLDLAMAMADKLDPKRCRVKVGKELFTRAGPKIVDALNHQGFDVFLDLKFHDIPNTVAKAVRAASQMGVWMVNVHASGGRRMMDQARNELEKLAGNQTLLIAVTVLTSMNQEDLKEIGVDVDPQQQVLKLAELTQQCGLDGVVCSAQEVAMLRAVLGSEFALVTPGIRLSENNSDDQRRIMSPADALRLGSSHLVIGRPITQAEQPLQALSAIEDDIQQSLAR